MYLPPDVVFSPETFEQCLKDFAIACATHDNNTRKDLFYELCAVYRNAYLMGAKAHP